MQIDVIIDTICPWCYIGQARLARALAARPGLRPTLVWRPFRLNPNMPEGGREHRSYMEAKFGGAQRALRQYRALERSARAEGIALCFDNIARTPNTLQSHRLIAYAARFGLGAEIVDALFRAYFVEGRDIGEDAVLAEIGAAHGLDGPAIEAYLASDEDRARMVAEDEHVRQFGVNGVPCYIVGGRYAVSGAQAPEVFLQVLDLARQDGVMEAAE